MTTVTFTTSGTWNAPAGITSADCQCWGEGGKGAAGVSGSHSAGGGGGGEYSEETTLAVTAGGNYSYTIGTGGTGTDTSFPGDAVTVTAHAGASASNTTGGAAGSGSTNTIHFSGGSGGNGTVGSSRGGGGGGSSAGTGSVGGNGASNSGGTSGGAGGTAPAGGGNGGAGAASTVSTGVAGTAPGGAGGGGSTHAGTAGGAGAAGQISLTYTATVNQTASLSGVGTLTANGGLLAAASLSGVGTLLAQVAGRQFAALTGVGTLTAHATERSSAALTGVGTLTAFGSAPTPAVVNQWGYGYLQGGSFNNINPVLQSVPVPLDPAFSVGAGSGVSTPGSWLFVISSWTQDPSIAETHIGVGDDIHSWWREYPASNIAGATRTSVSYTPNIARVVNNVYVAPDNEVAAINVLVVEVSGLGPWDTLTWTDAEYEAASTSITLIGGNQLSTNPYFTNGSTTGWTPFNGTLTGSTSPPAGCPFPAAVEYINNGVTAGAIEGSPSPWAASPSISYTMSAWVYTSFGSVQVGFDWQNGSHGFLSSTTANISVPSNTWTYVTTTQTSNASAAFGYARVGANSSSGETIWATAILSLGPPAQTFWIAGIGGDNTASGQAFAPSGWTTLATQTQTNGTDHATDNILTAAVLPSSASAISVSGTASSENLSGFLLGVRVAAPDPTVGSVNPNWPVLKFEAAFGGGFNTPNSELTWTDITSRLWGYDETTGIQFQLGQLQATNLNLDLDNYDAALSPDNSSSPYYPNVTSGTPIRIRAAIGTIAGVTANRWYVIQRNAQEWPEEIDPMFRRIAPATGTDVWAVLSASGPTPYRGEVYADSPYAWFPCDDQPQSGGVLPVILLNAAQGNDNPLNILISPLGAVAQTASPGGAPEGNYAPANSAVYTVGADSGWMFGDPVSTPASAVAGNEITASPGAAAWQQTGLLGTTGSYGWFLSCNDAGFPALSGGITVEGWFNYNFSGSAQGYGNDQGGGGGGTFDYAGQPAAALTLIELATSSNPVAMLQLDTSGHLNLITYNGSTGTSHSVYSSSDLRSQGWFQVTMTLTTTTWTVWLDGGDLSKTSGTATGMTSAWTWFLANADMGSGGGGQTSGIGHGGNVSIAHLAVYPYILPNWRIQAHYWAAVTGFGLIPAPGTPSLSGVSNPTLTNLNQNLTFTADGSAYSGSYGVSAISVLAAQATANAGGFTSGPSGWGQSAITGTYDSNAKVFNGAAAFVSWTGLATSFNVYTSAQVNAGAQAATVQGDSVTFKSGYGAGASVTGPGIISTGGGGSPPSTASAIGDTVANRIERALGYGNVTYPGRCIDAASLLVQAGLDLGGQQAGQNVQNIAISDGGMLFIDNAGKLNYWQRSHLASQYSTPVWQIGPSSIPYDVSIKWILDPQRAWNAIEVQPYSPSGAQLPIITPANGSGVIASQKQFGAQPFQVNSYLQDTSEMQNQANWLFTNFGQPERRAESVKIDAATDPRQWTLVLGVNIGDVVQLEDWQIGGGGNISTYRVTEIKRTFRFGDAEQGGDVTASVELTLDYEPPSYWT